VRWKACLLETEERDRLEAAVMSESDTLIRNIANRRIPQPRSYQLMMLLLIPIVILLGSVAYIATGIFFLITDADICFGTDADMLWSYCIVTITLPITVQYLLKLLTPEEARLTRISVGVMVSGVLLMTGYWILFRGGVCPAQKDIGGLYTWALVQFYLTASLLAMSVCLVTIGYGIVHFYGSSEYRNLLSRGFFSSQAPVNEARVHALSNALMRAMLGFTVRLFPWVMPIAVAVPVTVVGASPSVDTMQRGAYGATAHAVASPINLEGDASYQYHAVELGRASSVQVISAEPVLRVVDDEITQINMPIATPLQ
jgi:hypothetical protein